MGSSQSTNSNNNGNNNNIVYHHGPPGSYPGQLLTRSAQTPRSTPSNPPSSSSSRPTQSSPTPTTTAPPNSPLPRGIISTVSSLFSDIYTPDIIHNHPPSSPTNHTPPDIQIVISSLQHKGLPSELIPPILDLAEYWSSCHRELKRAVAVSAGSRSPRDVPATSTARWLSGQEDDLAGMMGQEGCGLRDQDGEVWYLVSDPIGCVERYAAAPTVVEPPTSAQVDGENGEDASGEASGEGNDERKGWLRRVKVTTLSKDQGWSTSNTQHYGQSHLISLDLIPKLKWGFRNV